MSQGVLPDRKRVFGLPLLGRILHMTIGFVALGAMVVLVMYLIVSRFWYAVREPTTMVERVGLTAVSVLVVLTGVWAAAKIAHDYRGGNGFAWAFMVVGILCPIVKKQMMIRLPSQRQFRTG